MRRQALVLALLFAAMALLGLGTAYVRSTIPRVLSGKVERLQLSANGMLSPIRTQVRRYTNGNDYFLLTVNGHRIVIDRRVASLLRPGDTISKKRFSTTLTVNGKPRRLHLSKDFHHMLIVYPLLAILLALALASAARSGQKAAGDRSTSAA